MPRGNRPTYRRALVIAEFNRLIEWQKDHPDFVIMPSDMAKTLDVAHTTVRRHLKDAGLWTKELHDATVQETLRRINASKRQRGNPSLARQREAGFPNLQRARQRLAEIHSRGVESEAQDGVNIGASAGAKVEV